MVVQLRCTTDPDIHPLVLHPGTNTIGRSEKECEFVLRNSSRKVLKTISSTHCTIHIQDDVITLNDAQSVNGTFVNDQHLVGGSGEAVNLTDGDEIRFGYDSNKYVVDVVGDVDTAQPKHLACLLLHRTIRQLQWRRKHVTFLRWAMVNTQKAEYQDHIADLEQEINVMHWEVALNKLNAVLERNTVRRLSKSWAAWRCAPETNNTQRVFRGAICLHNLLTRNNRRSMKRVFQNLMPPSSTRTRTTLTTHESGTPVPSPSRPGNPVRDQLIHAYVNKQLAHKKRLLVAKCFYKWSLESANAQKNLSPREISFTDLPPDKQLLRETVDIWKDVMSEARFRVSQENRTNAVEARYRNAVLTRTWNGLAQETARLGVIRRGTQALRSRRSLKQTGAAFRQWHQRTSRVARNRATLEKHHARKARLYLWKHVCAWHQYAKKHNSGRARILRRHAQSRVHRKLARAVHNWKAFVMQNKALQQHTEEHVQEAFGDVHAKVRREQMARRKTRRRLFHALQAWKQHVFRARDHMQKARRNARKLNVRTLGRCFHAWQKMFTRQKWKRARLFTVIRRASQRRVAGAFRVWSQTVAAQHQLRRVERLAHTHHARRTLHRTYTAWRKQTVNTRAMAGIQRYACSVGARHLVRRAFSEWRLQVVSRRQLKSRDTVKRELMSKESNISDLNRQYQALYMFHCLTRLRDAQTRWGWHRWLNVISYQKRKRYLLKRAERFYGKRMLKAIENVFQSWRRAVWETKRKRSKLGHFIGHIKDNSLQRAWNGWVHVHRSRKTKRTRAKAFVRNVLHRCSRRAFNAWKEHHQRAIAQKQRARMACEAFLKRRVTRYFFAWKRIPKIRQEAALRFWNKLHGRGLEKCFKRWKMTVRRIVKTRTHVVSKLKLRASKLVERTFYAWCQYHREFQHCREVVQLKGKSEKQLLAAKRLAMRSILLRMQNGYLARPWSHWKRGTQAARQQEAEDMRLQRDKQSLEWREKLEREALEHRGQLEREAAEQRAQLEQEQKDAVNTTTSEMDQVWKERMKTSNLLVTLELEQKHEQQIKALEEELFEMEKTLERQTREHAAKEESWSRHRNEQLFLSRGGEAASSVYSNLDGASTVFGDQSPGFFAAQDEAMPFSPGGFRGDESMPAPNDGTTTVIQPGTGTFQSGIGAGTYTESGSSSLANTIIHQNELIAELQSCLMPVGTVDASASRDSGDLVAAIKYQYELQQERMVSELERTRSAFEAEQRAAKRSHDNARKRDRALVSKLQRHCEKLNSEISKYAYPGRHDREKRDAALKLLSVQLPAALKREAILKVQLQTLNQQHKTKRAPPNPGDGSHVLENKVKRLEAQIQLYLSCGSIDKQLRQQRVIQKLLGSVTPESVFAATAPAPSQIAARGPGLRAAQTLSPVQTSGKLHREGVEEDSTNKENMINL